MHKSIKLAGTAAVAVLLAVSGPASAKTSAPATTAQAAQPHQKTAMAAHKAKPAHAKGSAAVSKLQTALNQNGADLKVDGVMGPATRKALKKYQAAHGLKATGKLDKSTRAKLLA